MKYLSTFETAKKWGISPRRILNLIKSGRIPEAKFVSSRWLIPENLEKPIDGRTKTGKTEYQDKDCFRYQNFEFKDISSFNPPLTNEELIIKNFIEAFNGFHFNEAKLLLKNLPDKSQNRYIRITALYCGCMLNILLCNISLFLNYYGKLKLELSKDFPHKVEMSEYLHEIDATIGYNGYYAYNFHTIPVYKYHESFLERLCNLSTVSLAFGEESIDLKNINAAEIYCAFLEKNDAVFDLQALHIYLACAYATINKTEASNNHFCKALTLAEKYDMFYTIATMQYYYNVETLNKALENFSDEFKNKIYKCNNYFHQSHIEFTNALKLNNLYNLLTSNDYIYIAFALQGLTNKEVSERMHKSIGTIGKRYSDIYASLNVKNKAEMLELYQSLENTKIDI